MKLRILRSLAALAALSLAAVGCHDGSSPTGAQYDDPPMLSGTTGDGIVDPGPLFRSIGPSFNVSSFTQSASGFLTAAADAQGNGRRVHAVRRIQSIPKDLSKTKLINPAEGGTIRLGRVGMAVKIPAGALPGTEPVEITLMAYKGKYHVYEFLPHGTQFSKPVRVTFDIANVQTFHEFLQGQRALLELQNEFRAYCEARVAQGKKIWKPCRVLLAAWESHFEDVEWYLEALNRRDYVGVYFEGDVSRSGALEALELFDVRATPDRLRFFTDHFSGYALGM